jgi:hypothetical protein
MSTVPHRPRRTVAAYDDYAQAQRAVDHLSDQGFPVERVAIVGHGVRYIEQVLGRMTVGRAALLGAAQGAILGVLLGALASIFFTLSPSPATVLVLLYGLVIGAAVGALLGALLHAATGGHRDFASAPGITAERYEVVVDQEYADRAAELLRGADPQNRDADGTRVRGRTAAEAQQNESATT